jgi:4-hydroxyphenylpyruvate dioxygenase-like putative hemolysin
MGVRARQVATSIESETLYLNRTVRFFVIQNIQRIDHIVFLVHLENLETAMRDFEQLLDITLSGPHYKPDMGIKIYVDWESGIEIYAPVNPEIAVEQSEFLRTRGEGIFRLVFGVADREAAIARAENLGHPIKARVGGFSVTDDWRSVFKRLDEAPLAAPVHGVWLNFGQLEPVD